MTRQVKYHYSPPGNEGSIGERGLFPRHPDTGESLAEQDGLPAGVYLWDDPSEARSLTQAGASGGVYEVDVGGLSLQPDPFHSGGAWYSPDPIPPERITRIAARHIASILDPIHSALDPRVFDNPADPAPTLRPELQSWIPQTIFEVLDRHGYDHPENWLTLVLTGSLTTYQYGDASDCDISLFIDTEKLPDWSRAEMIGFMVSDFDNVNLPGTPHPMQAFVVASGITPQDLYKPGLRSGYVVYGDGAGTWIVPPDRDRIHDVEKEMNDAYTVGLLAADKLDLLLRYEPARAVEYWHQLHKQRQAEQTAGKGDYATSNVVFKMLVNRGLAADAARLAGDRFIPS